MNEDTTPMRCMAVTGSVYTGPLYCGNKTTMRDDNGRPCCRRHINKQLFIEWRGDAASYPHGSYPIGPKWGWSH